MVINPCLALLVCVLASSLDFTKSLIEIGDVFSDDSVLRRVVGRPKLLRFITCCCMNGTFPRVQRKVFNTDWLLFEHDGDRINNTPTPELHVSLVQ